MTFVLVALGRRLKSVIVRIFRVVISIPRRGKDQLGCIVSVGLLICQ